MADLAGGLDLADLSDILKEWYVGPTAEQLNQEVAVTQLLDVTSENLEGLKAVLPQHVSRSGGMGARRERQALPSAGKQGYARAEFDLKYQYARVEVTGQSIQRTSSERGAFLQALKAELAYIRKDIQLDMARQFYGDGTGVIATVLDADGANSATQTISSAEPISKGFLYIGAVVDILNASTLAAVSGGTDLEVVDVDVSLKHVTFSASVDLTAVADFSIVRSGNVDATAVNEIDAGLRSIIATSGSVGGINPATAGNGYWKGIVKTPGASVAIDDLVAAYNEVNNAGGRADQTVVMTTPGLLRRLFSGSDFAAKVQFVNSTTLVGGFEKVSFAAGAGPMTIHADRLHPWGEYTMVDKSAVKVFSPADWDFLARDGLTIRWVSDYDAFQALLFRYINMGCDRRNTSLRITGLTDTGF